MNSFEDLSVTYGSSEELGSFFNRLQPVRRIYAGRDLRSISHAAIPAPDLFVSYWRASGSVVSVTAIPRNVIVFSTVLAGRALLELDGRSLDLRAGDSLIAFPGDYAVQEVRDAAVVSARVTTGNCQVARFMAAPFQERSAFKRKLEKADSVDIANLLTFYGSECARLECQPRSPQLAVLREAVVSRLRAQLAASGWAEPDVSSEHRDIVRKCKSAMAEAKENLSLEELTFIGMCSTRQLYRAFNAVVGVSPQVYQKRCRLITARTKIIIPQNWEMKESMVGFESASTFVRSYRKEFDETPSVTRSKVDTLVGTFLRFK